VGSALTCTWIRSILGTFSLANDASIRAFETSAQADDREHLTSRRDGPLDERAARLLECLQCLQCAERRRRQRRAGAEGQAEPVTT
jgi:hypothetical protein